MRGASKAELAAAIGLIVLALVVCLSATCGVQAAEESAWRYPQAVEALGVAQILAVVGQYEPPRTALEVAAVGPQIGPAVEAAQDAAAEVLGSAPALMQSPQVQEAWAALEAAMWREVRAESPPGIVK
jgi:hypothetical protein